MRDLQWLRIFLAFLHGFPQQLNHFVKLHPFPKIVPQRCQHRERCGNSNEHIMTNGMSIEKRYAIIHRTFYGSKAFELRTLTLNRPNTPGGSVQNHTYVRQLKFVFQFNEDQRIMLTDILVSPNYYA